MRRGFALVFALVLGPSPLIACGEASFDADGGLRGVTGGNETAEAGALATQTTPGPPEDYSPLTPGNTWTALYNDYFAAPQMLDGGFAGGRAACSGTPGNCHGSASSSGTMASNYLCAGDATDAGKDDCYASLTSQMVEPVLLTAGAPFDGGGLYEQLRSVDNPSGPMPLLPPAAYTSAYAFTATDLARLSAWVDAGFPNN